MSASNVELSKADLIVFPSLDSAVMSGLSTDMDNLYHGSYGLEVSRLEMFRGPGLHCLIKR